jgi:chlorite dismutase
VARSWGTCKAPLERPVRDLLLEGFLEMPDQTPATLNHFAFFSFTSPYFELNKFSRKSFHQDLLSGLSSGAENLDIYQVYPLQAGMDIMVWSAVEAASSQSAQTFFDCFARATNPYRRLLEPKATFWGFTKPSQYTKSRSTQEIDPFSRERKPYLILYPFAKTADWYLMSREARQGMMNEHIRVGKTYEEITQLLLYSFGVQDQEFVVVYEAVDLTRFSDLVYELRSTEARRFTLRDTPNFSAIYHPAEETLALWE